MLLIFCWDATMNINAFIQMREKNKVLGVGKLKSMYKKGKVHGEENCLFKYYKLLRFQMFKCQKYITFLIQGVPKTFLKSLLFSK